MSFLILPGKLRKFFFIDYKTKKVHKYIKPSTADLKNMYIKQLLTYKSHISVKPIKEKTEVRRVPGSISKAMMASHKKLLGVKSRGELGEKLLLETCSLAFSVWELLVPSSYRATVTPVQRC